METTVGVEKVDGSKVIRIKNLLRHALTNLTFNIFWLKKISGVIWFHVFLILNLFLNFITCLKKSKFI